MSDFPYEPMNRYLFRPETCDRLYFGVTKMLTGPGYSPDDPIDVEREMNRPVCYTLVYVNTFRIIDNKHVFKLEGAM